MANGSTFRFRGSPVSIGAKKEQLMNRLNFKAHQVVLTDALCQTIRQHVENHGGQFREQDLEHMSVSLDQVAGEALMFGGDCWPCLEEKASNDNVVVLYPPANPTPLPNCIFGICKVGVLFKALLLRWRVAWRIKLLLLLPITNALHNKTVHLTCQLPAITG